MSDTVIQLLGKVVVTKPNASKSYQQMVVTHKDLNTGKPDGKKIFDFTTPKEVWDTLLAANGTETFVIGRQKDKKEGKYWEWVSIKPADAASLTATSSASPAYTPATTTAPSPTTKVGNWETQDERARKQIYIVRQSSLSNAIEYYKSINSGTHTEMDVIGVARIFEYYVFGNGVAGLTDDIPE